MEKWEMGHVPLEPERAHYTAQVSFKWPLLGLLENERPKVTPI